MSKMLKGFYIFEHNPKIVLNYIGLPETDEKTH